MQPLRVLRSYREAPREEDMGCYLSQQEGIWPQGLDIVLIKSYCCSVAKSHQSFCDPMDCSTPGFPVLHYLPEFAQTHVR